MGRQREMEALGTECSFRERRADEATRKLPDHANVWYMQAFVLGRYAQRISIVKALAEGIGGKVRRALDRALELEPRHADAHIALGSYHGRGTYTIDPTTTASSFGLSLEPGVVACSGWLGEVCPNGWNWIKIS